MSNKKQRIPEKLENLILNYLAQSDVRRNNCQLESESTFSESTLSALLKGKQKVN
jgi:hypothetical protein